MRSVISELSCLLIPLLAFSACDETIESSAHPSKIWNNLGPGGGGAVYSCTVNPSDPDNVLICCDMTGAYVTWDGGENWRNFNLRAVVNDFEFDPSDTGTVYAANSALYRSRDKGRIWELIYPDPSNVTGERMVGDEADQSYVTVDGMPGGVILKVTVDPADGNRIWIGVQSSRNPGGAEDSSGVLVSIDSGASWRRLTSVPGRRILGIFPADWLGDSNNATVITEKGVFRLRENGVEAAILETPENSGIIAATGGQRRGESGVLYLLTAMTDAGGGQVRGGVYRSEDNAVSWKQVNTGLLDGWMSSGNLPAFRTLDACEGSPEVLYLSCSSFPVLVNGQRESHFGTLSSVDGGENWQWSYRGSERGLLSGNYTGYWKDRSYGISWAGEPNSYGICPSRPEVCFLTDNRTLRTRDGGKHWEQVGSRDLPDSSAVTRGMEGTTTYGVHFDPFDPQKFLVSYADLGLFRTLNCGLSWRHAIDGIPEQWRNTCYWLEFDPETRGRIYAVWSGAHDLPRTKMYYPSSTLGRFKGGVAVSDDGGGSWRASSNGLPAGTIPTHIVLDASSHPDARKLYICAFGHGVYKSADGAVSWKAVDHGIDGSRNCWRICRLPSGKLFLLVFKSYEAGRLVNGALYSSVDEAESWRRETLPPGVIAPNDLTYDPVDPERLYLAAWPWQQGDSLAGGGLWLSEDGGRSWNKAFNPASHVFSVTVDPHHPETLYIATFNSGVWRSDDRGLSWRRLTGFNFKWAHRATPDPYRPDMLNIATFGGSLYYGPSNGVSGAVEDITNYRESWRMRP